MEVFLLVQKTSKIFGKMIIKNCRKIFIKNFLHSKKLEKKWSRMLFLSVKIDHWNREKNAKM